MKAGRSQSHASGAARRCTPGIASPTCTRRAWQSSRRVSCVQGGYISLRVVHCAHERAGQPISSLLINPLSLAPQARPIEARAAELPARTLRFPVELPCARPTAAAASSTAASAAVPDIEAAWRSAAVRRSNHTRRTSCRALGTCGKPADRGQRRAMGPTRHRVAALCRVSA